jgi:metal-responsive CopG/Arc/MetJ family transcriptional regulator
MSKLIRIPISIRLPERLLNALDEFIKKQSPAIKDRTHAIEVALDKLIKGKMK